MRTTKRFPIDLPVVAAVAILVAVWATATQSPAAGLRDQVEQAKKEFRPITQKDVDQGAGQVRKALQAVQAFVGRNTVKAVAWKKFMLWNEQLEHLSQSGPQDLAFWQRLLRRERRNSPGLEHPSFRFHRAALQELVDVIAATEHEDLKGEYEKTLSELAAALPPGDENLSPAQVERITQLTTRLYHQGQAADLVQQIRQRYGHPNLQVTVPAKFLVENGNGGLDSNYGVNDNINGARVTGSGRLTGTRQFQLRADEQRGLLGVSFSGTTNSTTQAYKEGVRVQTQSVLRFTSVSAVHIDAEGFDVQPFATNAQLNNRIQWISTSYSGRRNSEARSRVYGRQEVDRREGQRKATYRLSTSFYRELNAQFEPAQAFYEDRLRKPLLRYDKFPDDVQVSSDQSQLLIRADCAAGYQLPAQAPPPSFGKDSEVKVAIHQSALNNTVSAFLAAETMPLHDAVRRTLDFGSESDDAEPADDDAKLQIKFTDSQPFHVSFDSGQIALTLSGASYQKGEQRYAGMDIVLRFRPEQKSGKWWLVQTKPPEVMLPRLPDGTRPKLGVRDYALRRILTNVIQRDVPERAELEPFELPPPLNQTGEMVASSVLVRDGWFCLASKEVE